MMPRLYPPDAREFTTNGIGVLSDTVDCTVLPELNGMFELELQYPVGGLHYEDISMRSIIFAEPEPGAKPQPMRVYHMTKPHNRVVTVYARHVAYDLQGITVSPFAAEGCRAALAGLKAHATTECPFEFWTDKDTGGTFSVDAPTDIWTLLGGSEGSILDTFHGEYEFDGFTVKLHERRGADRGVEIRYGKNLTSLQQDENCANCYTGAHPYWMDGDGNTTELPEKILLADGDYGYTKIMPLDLSREFETRPTAEQMRSHTRRYMADNKIGAPKVSLRVKFVPLEQTVEYRHTAQLERVRLGDTVTVVFPDLRVKTSSRVIASRYKPILERYEDVSIGDLRASFPDTVARQGKGLAACESAIAGVERAVRQITGGGGKIAGKTAMWMDNGDGTFTLTGA